MKISIVADCHLNKALFKGVLDKKYTSLPFRTVDFMKAFRSIIKENIEEIKPDLMVIAGDVYDTYDPSNEVRAFFNRQLKELTEANIPVIVLVGNHDICKKHHALYPLKNLNLQNVTIIEEPELTIFEDKILMLFPYSLQVERGEIPIKEQLYSFIEETKETISNNTEYQNKDIFFFGHFGVKGATLKSIKKGDSIQKITSSDSHDISVNDLDLIGAKYIFLGDYHQHQVLPTKNSIAMYTGSIEYGDMSERHQKKGYVVYDDSFELSAETGKSRFIEYANCRPMFELKGNMEKMNAELENMPESKGAIVKIYFEGNNSELLDFSMGLDDLKKKIQAKLKPIHLWHEQKVYDKEQDKEVIEIQEEILEKGHLNEDLVLKVIEEIIKEKEKDENEQKKLLDLAQDIYKEAMIK